MTNKNNNYRGNRKGFVALISVMIIGAIGLLIVLYLASMGMGATQTSFVLEQSNKAKYFAESCAEEALMMIREDESFQGTDTISFEYGNCFYEVINLGGEQRLINAQGTAGNTIRRERIEVSEIGEKIILNSWDEIAEF